jgi:hypothetical protein
MKIKASARSIAILVAGLLVPFADPSLAAADAQGSSPDAGSMAAAPMTLDRAKASMRHPASHAHRKFRKIALRLPGADAPAEAAPQASNPVFEIPPAVANANARLLPSTNLLADNARMMSERAADLLHAPAKGGARADSEMMLVAADQLNDVDRSLGQSGLQAPAAANAPASPEPPAPVPAVSHESPAWNQTSLIGKIFIGFGALLTVASAVRMFMA